MREKDLIRLEARIRRLMTQIESGKVTPRDSGIAPALNMMKKLDEVLYQELLDKYKLILNKLK